MAILLIAVTAAEASVAFRQFQLKNLGRRVEVTWMTSREQGCTEFVVERSTDGVEFFTIATGISPHGANQEYRYIDSSVFKETDNTYYYRIVAKITSGSNQYSRTESIQVDSNGLQRTWGGLKAMFR